MPLAFCIFHKEQNHMVKRILQYFRRETVLSAALICALLSFLLTPPSVIHLQGIDTTTLLMLFSLMTIVAGFRRMGALDAVSRKLTRRVMTLRGLSAVMVALCFVLSMLVTNDVALLTLVPLTLLLFRAGGQKSTIWTVVLETVAANLGSMVTPIGNPQNLYLYTSGRLTALDFLTLLAPYAAVALALLALCLLLPKERVAVDTSARAPLAGKMLTLYGALSALALLAIAKVLPAWALAAAVFLGTLALDRGTIRQVDYTLLATFVCFFVFVASVKACVPVRAWLEAMMARSPMAVALLTSQVISNVPACLLLSPFTQDAKALALGVDLGGLGTLIASLASLISFRLYGAGEGAQKGRYFAVFTGVNVLFLAVMLFLTAIL
jgi:Na+/H+ antiporter NhaD/arsenite permease-like protein